MFVGKIRIIKDAYFKYLCISNATHCISFVKVYTLLNKC